MPHQEYFDHPDWAVNIGFLNIKGSYVHLHENLLDLSHLSFLHDKTFGTPEYARAPIESTVEDEHFEVWRHVECVLPPIYSKPLGWGKRKSNTQFRFPVRHPRPACQHGDSEEPGQAGKNGKAATPGQGGATDNPRKPTLPPTTTTPSAAISASMTGKWGAFMLKANQAAFSEDVFAIEHINRMQDTDQTPDFYEIDVPADRPGVAMRRRLKKLSDAEQV